MVDYATTFGVLFILVTLVFTGWITWISLKRDVHGPSMESQSSNTQGSSS